MKKNPGALRGVAGTVCVVAVALPTSRAGAVVHPIVDYQSGYLLGQSSDRGRIQTARPAPSTPAKNGARRYRVYAWNRYLGQANGTTPNAFGAPCEETLFVKFAPSAETARFRQGVVAVTGSWNALPRVPRIDRTVQPAYRKSVDTILRRAGIEKPSIKINKVMRVDLEGDGTYEVLITATNHKGTGEPRIGKRHGGISPSANAGDYSLVFLRKIVRGKVQTIMLESMAFTKDRSFAAPILYTVEGVFDLNGDGKMEILVGGQYYEGNWSTVYGVNGAKVTTLAESGCGA